MGKDSNCVLSLTQHALATRSTVFVACGIVVCLQRRVGKNNNPLYCRCCYTVEYILFSVCLYCKRRIQKPLHMCQDNNLLWAAVDASVRCPSPSLSLTISLSLSQRPSPSRSPSSNPQSAVLNIYRLWAELQSQSAMSDDRCTKFPVESRPALGQCHIFSPFIRAQTMAKKVNTSWALTQVEWAGHFGVVLCETESQRL